MNSIDKPNKQAERSLRMRERVLNAALDCIYEDGMQNASTTEIVKRAGVSRGAMLHHFPSKELLIAAAVEKLLNDEIRYIREEASAYSRHEKSIDDFVDFLWTRFSGRLFMVTMDFLSTARTDDKLQEAVIPVSLHFHEAMNEIWSQFFHYEKSSAEKVQLLLNTTLCLMRGMGVQTVIRKDQDYFDGIRNYWKSILHSLLDEDPPNS